MSLRTKRESARDQVLDALEARFYDFAAELSASIESGQLDIELSNGTDIAINLHVQAPADLTGPEYGRSWWLG